MVAGEPEVLQNDFRAQKVDLGVLENKPVVLHHRKRIHIVHYREAERFIGWLENCFVTAVVKEFNLLSNTKLRNILQIFQQKLTLIHSILNEIYLLINETD